jgi:DNA-binding IclR family transcriptional regulator
VGRDGITIPLALTHACLADLVCLRRPTVTAALVRLREAGHLQRRADGSWRLAEDSLPLGTAAAAVSSG